MTVRYFCSRCDVLLTQDTMCWVRWLDPDIPGQMVDDQLCKPCHHGLDIIVQNYMNNTDLSPELPPSTVDTPDHVPAEWTSSDGTPDS